MSCSFRPLVTPCTADSGKLSPFVVRLNSVATLAIVATVGFAVIAMPLFGSVQPKVQSVQASQIGPSARAAMPRPQSPKLPTSFAIQPVLIVLGCMLAGTVLLLVSETGRESLNSIDFERAYREQHKPNSSSIVN